MNSATCLDSQSIRRRSLLTTVTMALLSTCLAGCGFSLQPIFADDDLKKPLRDARIEGEWISTDPGEAGTPNELIAQWSVTAPDKTNTSMPYLIECRPAKPGPTIRVPFTPEYVPVFQADVNAIRYDVRLVPMGDKIFLDADFREATLGSEKLSRETIVGMVPAHVLGRVWVERDLLRVAFLDSDWIKQHGPEGFWRSVTLGGADAAVLTATTDELRKFLLENADNQEAVGPAFYLCRPGTDCSLRAMDEELRRRPEDKQVLEDAAGFFTARGDYTKGVGLWRRATVLASKNTAAHVWLGEALLFTRDFEGARREFTAVPDPTLKKPSACRDVMWSYFLEGKWAEVPQAAANCRASDDSWTAEAILLTYHSLLRLDRRDEAEAYLKQEAAKFEGAMDDHALLLNAEGRTGIWSPCNAAGEEDLRCNYFVSLNEEKRGGTQAKQWLERIVNKAPKDSLFGLAARIELERLASTQAVGTQRKPDQ